MPRTGKCTNYADCLLAYRMESITLPDDAPFDCPECKQPLIEGGVPPGRRPIAVPAFILGGISILVVMASGAVYYQARKLGQYQPTGQIGSSFEQAEVAVTRGELMPSRHMSAISPSPTPTSPIPGSR